MKNYELNESLKEMAKKFSFSFDVIPCDHLPDFKWNKFPMALIVNTDPSTAPGQHWVLFYRKTPYSDLEGFDR